MSSVKFLRKPTRPSRKAGNPFNILGTTQKESMAMELKEEAGAVAVIGRTNVKPYLGQGYAADAVNANKFSIGYSVISSLMRKILMTHFKVNVQDENQKMLDLFPLTVRTHYTVGGTTNHIMLMPHDGFFGIEWVVKIDAKYLSAEWAVADTQNLTLPHKDIFASIGITKVNQYMGETATGTALGLGYIDHRPNATYADTIYKDGYTFERFVHSACRALLFGCGNRNVTTKSNTLNTNVTPATWTNTEDTIAQPQNDYSVNYFAPLGGWSPNRDYTAPYTTPFDTQITTSLQRIPAEAVEIYGYRLIYYDTDNTSQSVEPPQETEWSYKYSNIFRLDNVHVKAKETSMTLVKNVTLADNNGGGNTDALLNIDPNPCKGKLFHFKGKPQTNSIPTLERIRMNNVAFSYSNTPSGAPQTFATIVQDGQQGLVTYGGNVSDVIFNPSDDNGYIYRTNQGNNTSVKLSTIPNPDQFTNAKFTNVYFLPGQSIMFPTHYYFKGLLKNFLKYVPIKGRFPDPKDAQTTAGQFTFYLASDTWDTYRGTNEILCVERANRHTAAEPSPALEIRTKIFRSAKITYDKKVPIPMADGGLTFITPPVALKS